MKRLVLGFFLAVILLFIPQIVEAEGEFSASYNVKYDVNEEAQTFVNEKVTLKNNTDKFFPSSFSLLISATNLENVTARDADGPLEVVVERQGKKSQITVKFTKQIGGKDKQYAFDLNFTSPDFVQKNGDITTVSVPKVGSAEDISSYVLSLSVPVTLGDPSFLTPDPKNQSEGGGRLNFVFNKEQLTQSGVLGIFGSNQTFDFALSYELENDTILPKVDSIGIPTPSAFQHILIKNIDPKGDNWYSDAEGYTFWKKGSELQIIKDVVLSSMPADRAQALRFIKLHNGKITAKELSQLSERSSKTSKRLLDELCALKVLDKFSGLGRTATDYKLNDKYNDFILLSPSEFLEKISGTENPQSINDLTEEEIKDIFSQNI
jgi:hypothetical protein